MSYGRDLTTIFARPPLCLRSDHHNPSSITTRLKNLAKSIVWNSYISTHRRLKHQQYVHLSHIQDSRKGIQRSVQAAHNPFQGHDPQSETHCFTVYVE